MGETIPVSLYGALEWDEGEEEAGDACQCGRSEAVCDFSHAWEEEEEEERKREERRVGLCLPCLPPSAMPCLGTMLTTTTTFLLLILSHSLIISVWIPGDPVWPSLLWHSIWFLCICGLREDRQGSRADSRNRHPLL